MLQTILPSEILLNILYHLDGDWDTKINLARTCKSIRDLLQENEPRIAATIAANHGPGPIRLLLERTAPTEKPPSFAWLHRAYARGHAIELLVNALENSGLYKDQSIFGTVFSLYGRPLVPADYTDVRRYVVSMLLATEITSMSGRTCAQKCTLVERGPRWATGFSLHSRKLMRFLVSVLHTCVKQTDITKLGTPDVTGAWIFAVDGPEYLTDFLYHGVLLAGARGIVDIISTTYDTYHEFEAVARYRLYADYVKHQDLATAWPNGTISARTQLLETIERRSADDEWNALAQVGLNRSEELKEYALEIDIDKWKEDIPDDDAWTHFMQKYEWSRPLKFEPHQLYKKILEQIKPRLGENLWDVSEYLRKPVLAR